MEKVGNVERVESGRVEGRGNQESGGSRAMPNNRGTGSGGEHDVILPSFETKIPPSDVVDPRHVISIW